MAKWIYFRVERSSVKTTDRKNGGVKDAFPILGTLMLWNGFILSVLWIQLISCKTFQSSSQSVAWNPPNSWIPYKTLSSQFTGLHQMLLIESSDGYTLEIIVINTNGQTSKIAFWINIFIDVTFFSKLKKTEWWSTNGTKN